MRSETIDNDDNNNLPPNKEEEKESLLVENKQPEELKTENSYLYKILS
ncbi:MAG: hypothetical protein WBP64_19980 [Nitrososphaeraceae archaeon]